MTNIIFTMLYISIFSLLPQSTVQSDDFTHNLKAASQLYTDSSLAQYPDGNLRLGQEGSSPAQFVTPHFVSESKHLPLLDNGNTANQSSSKNAHVLSQNNNVISPAWFYVMMVVILLAVLFYDDDYAKQAKRKQP